MINKLGWDRTEPGLVVLYDIRPGNGAGLFLQPHSTGQLFKEQSNIHITRVQKAIVDLKALSTGGDSSLILSRGKVVWPTLPEDCVKIGQKQRQSEH